MAETRSRDFAEANFPHPTNKNVIIGGDFTTNPWQRGTSFTGVTGAYTADRWVVSESSAAVLDVLKTADAPTAAQAGVNTDHCLHVDVTTADTSIAAGDYAFVGHKVEGLNSSRFGFGEAGTRYVTVSFWHKHTVTGTYGLATCNGVIDRAYLSTYTQSVSDTWEKAEITVPVDITGTWSNGTGIGIYLIWTIAAGSNYHGTADTWNSSNVWTTSGQVNGLSSTSNNFKLALVQLEAGQVATAFEARDAGTELALCQRYYEKSFQMSTAPAQNVGFNHPGCFFLLAGNTTSYAHCPYQVRKRTTPTVTTYNTANTNANARDFGNTADGTLSVNSNGETGFNPGISTPVDNTSYQFNWTSDAEL